MYKKVHIIKSGVSSVDAEKWFLEHRLTKNSLKGYKPGTPCILYRYRDILYLPRGITFSKCSSQDKDCLRFGCLGLCVVEDSFVCCLHTNLDHVQMLCAAITKEELIVLMLE